MAANEEAVRALRMRVQVEWENAMDGFYERLDRFVLSSEIEEADVVEAVRRQIDQETADCYQEWIEG